MIIIIMIICRYVVSLDEANGKMSCLTNIGASHQAFVSPECSLVVTIENSLAQPSFVRLYKIVTTDHSMEVTSSGGDGDTMVDPQEHLSMYRKEAASSHRQLPRLQLIGKCKSQITALQCERHPEKMFTIYSFRQ